MHEDLEVPLFADHVTAIAESNLGEEPTSSETRQISSDPGLPRRLTRKTRAKSQASRDHHKTVLTST
jgi:hypothetical protein